jgi:hypothetical protein
MTTGKHLLHIQQLQLMEIMYDTLFLGTKLKENGLEKMTKEINLLGHLTLHLGLLPAVK